MNNGVSSLCIHHVLLHNFPANALALSTKEGIFSVVCFILFRREFKSNDALGQSPDHRKEQPRRRPRTPRKDQPGRRPQTPKEGPTRKEITDPKERPARKETSDSQERTSQGGDLRPQGRTSQEGDLRLPRKDQPGRRPQTAKEGPVSKNMLGRKVPLVLPSPPDPSLDG